MSKGIGMMPPIFYQAICEDRLDPLQLGRVRVRVFGIYSDNMADLPTDKLPWAPVVMPANNASTSGIGWSPNGIVTGTQVLVYFADGLDMQKPIVVGTMPGINVDVIPPPEVVSTWVLGQTSYEYETEAGASSGFISSPIHNPLGKQYGPWLISLNNGQLKEYIRNHCAFGSNMLGMIIGSNAFDDEWKKLGSGSDSAAFKQDQKDFIQSTRYNILLQSSFDLGLGNRGNGIQDMIWSIAVQYGSKTSIIREALGGKKVNELTDSDIIVLVQTHRKNTVRTKFKKTPSLWTKYEDRAEAEKIKLLALCDDKPSLASKKLESPSGTDVYKQNIYRSVDTSKVVIIGNGNSFVDPSGTYPRKLYKKDVDTNKLAQNNKSNETITKFKKSSIVRGKGFVEPRTKYSAKYPFNKVFESESGHIMEFDDTDNAERIHIYHRAGTFIEFHPDGTIVRKSMKDDVEVVVANKSCYIAGDCNIVIEGNSNMKVTGSMSAQVQQNIDFKAGGNISMMCNGELKLSSASIARLQGGTLTSIEGTEIAMITGASAPLPIDLNEKIVSELALAEEKMPEGVEDDTMTITVDAKAVYLPPVDDTLTATKVIVKENVAVIDEVALGDKFSKHYTLADLTTGVALPDSRRIVVEQCGLTVDEIELNLRTLARNCLDPVADRFGKGSFIITNAFRISNGSTSHHLSGCAADLQFTGLPAKEIPTVAEQIRQILPSFTQIILEYHGKNPVIHIGYAESKAASPFSRLTGNTRQCFTTYDTKFTQFKTTDRKGGFFDRNRALVYEVA